jgi:hypothetical protein
VTHKHELLSFSVVSGSEVLFFEDAGDRCKTRFIFLELLDDLRNSSGSGSRNSVDRVREELEKHGQEVSIDGLVIEKLSIISKIFGKNKLDSPFLLDGLLEGLLDVDNEVLSSLHRELS